MFTLFSGQWGSLATENIRTWPETREYHLLMAMLHQSVHEAGQVHKPLLPMTDHHKDYLATHKPNYELIHERCCITTGIWTAVHTSCNPDIKDTRDTLHRHLGISMKYWKQKIMVNQLNSADTVWLLSIGDYRCTIRLRVRWESACTWYTLLLVIDGKIASDHYQARDLF